MSPCVVLQLLDGGQLEVGDERRRQRQAARVHHRLLLDAVVDLHTAELEQKYVFSRSRYNVCIMVLKQNTGHTWISFSGNSFYFSLY